MKTCVKLSVAIIILIGANSLYAQNFYLEPEKSVTNLIGIKVSIPNFKQEEYNPYSVLSGCYVPYVQIGLKGNWDLYTEIPVIVANNDYEKQNGLGDIFFSFRNYLNEDNTSRISLGAYLPTIGKEKYNLQDIGLSSNIYRFSQFARSFTLYGNYAYQIPQSEKHIFGIEAGPEILVPIEGGDIEFLLHFGAKGGYKFNKLWLWSEIHNIMIVSEAGMNLGDRIISQMVFGGQMNFKRVKPGVFYSISLKKYVREYQYGVVGFKLDFGI